MSASVTKRPKAPLVEITWLDARDIYETSVTYEDALKYDLMERTHVGYLISTDERVTRIAAGVDQDGFDNLIILPTGWIRRLRYVRKPKNAAKAPKEPAASAAAAPTE